MDRETMKTNENMVLHTYGQITFDRSKTSIRGQICIFDNWRRIEIMLNDAQRKGTPKVYDNARRLAFLSNEEIELYNSVPLMSPNDIIKLIRSTKTVSTLPQRDIVLSSLVRSGIISDRYCLDYTGIYYDEKLLAADPASIEITAIKKFKNDLYSKIDKYGVLVYNYDYLESN
jgi:hypothetical protein